MPETERKAPVMKVDALEASALCAQRHDWPIVLGTELIQGARYKKLDGAAGKSMTLMEQKVLFSIISRIKKEDTELVPQYMSIRDFCKLCGIPVSGGKTLKEVMAVILRLSERTMWLYKRDEDSFVTVRWIDKAKVMPDGLIRITLDEDMKPYLLGLNKYTKLYLQDVIRMKSKYGTMLYQLLMSYKYLERPIVFYLQDFREIMDADKPSYQNLGKLKSRVIAPAVKDINTYSSIDISYEFISEHGVATKVRFSIRDLRESKDPAEYNEYVRRANLVEQEIADSGQPSSSDDVVWDYSGAHDVLVANGVMAGATYDEDNGDFVITPRRSKREVRATIPIAR